MPSINLPTIDHRNDTMVSARELHTSLQVKTKFSEWMKRRISQHGFVNKKDYVLLSNKGEQYNRLHYYVNIDTAIALTEHQDTSKQRPTLLKYLKKIKRQDKVSATTDSLPSTTEKNTEKNPVAGSTVLRTPWGPQTVEIPKQAIQLKKTRLDSAHKKVLEKAQFTFKYATDILGIPEDLAAVSVTQAVEEELNIDLVPLLKLSPKLHNVDQFPSKEDITYFTKKYNLKIGTLNKALLREGYQMKQGDVYHLTEKGAPHGSFSTFHVKHTTGNRKTGNYIRWDKTFIQCFIEKHLSDADFKPKN